MATFRERLETKLRDFFAAVVPAEADHIDVTKWLQIGLYDGEDVLNARLLKKYGTSLEYGFGASANNVGVGRDKLKQKVEFFYMCHNPAKLDDKEEVLRVVERGLYESVQQLNAALKAKYGKKLEEVSDDLAAENIMHYYEKVGVEKSYDECVKLVQYGKRKSFCEISKLLQDKYGQGFKTSEINERDLRLNLQRFLNYYDAENAEDADFVNGRVLYGVNNGRKKLNDALFEKYGATLDTVRGGPGSEAGRLKRLLQYGRWLLMKHDRSRLRDGGLDELREQLLSEGEDGLNASMKEQYDEDLTDIETEAVFLETRLKQFYRNYDPTGLGYITPKVGFGIINGRKKLNLDLRKNYDDDLDMSGLKARLRFYFRKVNVKVSPTDVDDAARWGFEHGISTLGAKLQSIYGDEFLGLQEFEVQDTSALSRDDLPPILRRDHARATPKPGANKLQKFLAKIAPEKDPKGDLEKKLRAFYNFYDPAKAEDDGFINEQLVVIESEGVQQYNEALQYDYGASLNTIDRLWDLSAQRTAANDKGSDKESATPTYI